MYQLFCDSNCELWHTTVKELGLNVIRMPYIVDDKEYFYDMGENTEFKAFFDNMRAGGVPKTAALNEYAYTEYFEPVLARGEDIYYITFSHQMSGTFNAMKLAWDELSEKYPDRKLYTLDTKGITICSLSIVKEVGKLAANGATPENILKWAETEVDKFAVYFYADDLKFFGRSGRVSGLAAFMGSLLGIRPIITMSSEGVMDSVSKAKGRKGTLKKLMDYVIELQEDIKNYPVIIGHADAYDLALELESMLKAQFGEDLPTEIVVVNPTAGSHCGPNTVGVSFHAKHR